MSNGRGDPGLKRRSANTGGNSFAVNFDFGDLFDGLDGISEKAGDLTRIAAQAGAEELYIEARLRCPTSAEAHYFYGTHSKKTGVRYLFSPGNLRNAIYQVYSKDNSKAGERATYHIAWNHKKAPYGFMVEFGTARASAHPFLRPAFDARYRQALEVAAGVYTEEMSHYLASMK